MGAGLVVVGLSLTVALFPSFTLTAHWSEDEIMSAGF